jgi:hypothetical protein
MELQNNDWIQIIGWFVIFGLQLLILLKQRGIQEDIEGYKIMTPMRLKQLQDCSSWVTEGYEIAYEYQLALIQQAEGKHAPFKRLSMKELTNRFGVWDAKSSKYITYAYGIWQKKFGGSLGSLLVEFSNSINTIFHAKKKDVIHKMKDRAVDDGLGEFSYLYDEEIVKGHYDLIVELDRCCDKAFRLPKRKTPAVR